MRGKFLLFQAGGAQKYTDVYLVGIMLFLCSGSGRIEMAIGLGTKSMLLSCFRVLVHSVHDL